MKKIALAFIAFQSCFAQTPETPARTEAPATPPPTCPPNTDLIGEECFQKCPDSEVFLEEGKTCKAKDSYPLNKTVQFDDRTTCQLSLFSSDTVSADRICFRENSKWIMSCKDGYSFNPPDTLLSVDYVNHKHTETCSYDSELFTCSIFGLENHEAQSCLRKKFPLGGAPAVDNLVSCSVGYDEINSKCVRKCPDSQNWIKTDSTCEIKQSYTKPQVEMYEDQQQCNIITDNRNYLNDFDYYYKSCIPVTSSDAGATKYQPDCEYGFKLDSTNNWNCVRDSTVTCSDFNMTPVPDNPNKCTRQVKDKSTKAQKRAERLANRNACKLGYTLIGNKCKAHCSDQSFIATADTCQRKDKITLDTMTIFESPEDCEASIQGDKDSKECVLVGEKFISTCPYGFVFSTASIFQCLFDPKVTCEHLGLVTAPGSAPDTNAPCLRSTLVRR